MDHCHGSKRKKSSNHYNNHPKVINMVLIPKDITEKYNSAVLDNLIDHNQIKAESSIKKLGIEHIFNGSFDEIKENYIIFIL